MPRTEAGPPPAGPAIDCSEATVKLQAKIVDAVDPAMGTVKLRRVEDADAKAPDTNSAKTVRTRK
jgi:hypothetical protein